MDLILVDCRKENVSRARTPDGHTLVTIPCKSGFWRPRAVTTSLRQATRETAPVLGVPETTVKARVWRARAQLKRHANLGLKRTTALTKAQELGAVGYDRVKHGQYALRILAL
jgi:hypothetical protein